MRLCDGQRSKSKLELKLDEAMSSVVLTMVVAPWRMAMTERYPSAGTSDGAVIMPHPSDKLSAKPFRTEAGEGSINGAVRSEGAKSQPSSTYVEHERLRRLSG